MGVCEERDSERVSQDTQDTGCSRPEPNTCLALVKPIYFSSIKGKTRTTMYAILKKLDNIEDMLQLCFSLHTERLDSLRNRLTSQSATSLVCTRTCGRNILLTCLV